MSLLLFSELILLLVLSFLSKEFASLGSSTCSISPISHIPSQVFAMSRSCKDFREDLRLCIVESECMRSGKDFHQCSPFFLREVSSSSSPSWPFISHFMIGLREADGAVLDEKCKSLRNAFSKCRKNWVLIPLYLFRPFRVLCGSS